MFLAINELLKEKTRFVLIILVVFLVSYLTFFLTALAYGLATGYTQGIEKWQASGIILQEDANSNIARSLIYEGEYSSFLTDGAELLGAGSATIEAKESDDVALFGINQNSFLSPNIVEGRAATGPNEVIVSTELKKIGVVVGYEMAFKGAESRFVVTGFSDRATFQTAPIVYMDIGAWRMVASDLAGMSGMKDLTTVSAVVTRGTPDAATLANSKLEWQTIKDFSFKLPGYKPQVLTFGTMIGFLIAISSFVLAIFVYILTLQKKSIFGILKAEGVSNNYIAKSVLFQTIIICTIGLVAGLGLTLISGLFLSGIVPFVVQPLFYIAIIFLFLFFAAVGGIASVLTVTKIDPVEAIA